MRGCFDGAVDQQTAPARTCLPMFPESPSIPARPLCPWGREYRQIIGQPFQQGRETIWRFSPGSWFLLTLTPWRPWGPFSPAGQFVGHWKGREGKTGPDPCIRHKQHILIMLKWTEFRKRVRIRWLEAPTGTRNLSWQHWWMHSEKSRT